MLKIIVVAGDFRQAALWCRHAGLEERDPQLTIVTEGSWLRRLMGTQITEEDRIVFVGTCWRRRDFQDIWDELVRRGWNQHYETG